MAEEVIRLVVNKDAEQPVIDSVVFATDNAGTIDQCKVVPVSEIDSLEEENNFLRKQHQTAVQAFDDMEAEGLDPVETLGFDPRKFF